MVSSRSRLTLGLCLMLSACSSSSDPEQAPDASSEERARLPRDSNPSEPAAADGGSDPAPDPDLPRGCGRATATATADVSLYDALTADLAGLSDDAAKARRLDDFFAEVMRQGGTPLSSRDAERVVFLQRGHPQASYSVAGSWNGWRAGEQKLAQVGGTDLYAADVRVPRDGPQAYKLVDGASWFEDRRARNVVWDGIDHRAPGELNAWVYPALTDPKAGRLVAWRGVHASALDDARDVFIYLPATYDTEACPRLPSIFFHDGNEALTRNPFTAAADRHYAEHPEQSAVLVFVALPTQDVRVAQYTFGPESRGDGYLAFLRDDLVPAVDKAFRTCARPVDRGISGASLGGLISSYAGFELPHLFGYVGSQSGSYFWNDFGLVKRAREGAVVSVRTYLDSGCPNDNCEAVRSFEAALQGRGYEVRLTQEPNAAHDWAFWQKRLPQLLSYFREGRGGCAP